jgi:putative membrane protein
MKIEAARLAGVSAGLMLLLAATACQGRTENAGRDQSAAASAATPPDTGAAGAGGGAAAATPKSGLGDSNIVALLDEANMADSAAGAVALKKATNPEVKAFAKLMMAEHHALRVQGQALAKQLAVTPKLPERDPLAGYIRNETDALKKTPKGAEFDRTYIDHEVSVHQAVLDLANQARVTTQTQELKDLIEKAAPIIKKHLDQAQEIQKKLGSTA